MLTQARLKEILSYDHETGIFTHLQNRGRAKSGGIAGSGPYDGYLVTGIDGKVYRCHRLAWLYMTGSWPDGETDHIDGNRSNNAFANLRDVSKARNLWNKKAAHINNKTGFLGVSMKKGRYIAQIQVNNAGLHIGCYDTAEQAHEAYLRVKRELHDTCTI